MLPLGVPVASWIRDECLSSVLSRVHQIPPGCARAASPHLNKSFRASWKQVLHCRLSSGTNSTQNQPWHHRLPSSPPSFPGAGSGSTRWGWGWGWRGVGLLNSCLMLQTWIWCAMMTLNLLYLRSNLGHLGWFESFYRNLPWFHVLESAFLFSPSHLPTFPLSPHSPHINASPDPLWVLALWTVPVPSPASMLSPACPAVFECFTHRC